MEIAPECFKGWLDAIASGAFVPTSKVVDVVAAASVLLRPLVGVRRLETSNSGQDAPCVIFGPTRGHAVDLACQLRHKCFPGNAFEPNVSIVFLGNMIDGGDRSVETLFAVLATLVCLGSDRVVILRGAHEHLFPSFPESNMGPLVCRLSTELNVRELQRHDGVALTLTTIVADLFHLLPIACVVNDRYFCVSGGISHLCRRIEDIDCVFEERSTTTSQAALTQLLWNEPMDDDDAYSLPRDVQYASSEQYQGAFVFGFQAACNFLGRNGPLRCIIRGNHFTSNRNAETRNRCGRPWHYQHAPFDCGYRLFACHPSSGCPTVVSLFSAPSFCDANHNRGACAIVQKDALVMDAFDKVVGRPIQFPGSHRNAFAWSLPVLWRHATSAAAAMLSVETDLSCAPGSTAGTGASNEDLDTQREELKIDGIRRRMTLLAKLCAVHGHKLPLGIDDDTDRP